MCCFFASLALVGPRLAFLVLMLFPYGQAKAALAFNNLFWPLLGFLFLPWTTLTYVLVFPVYGFAWFWLALGVVLDIATYSSAVYRRRDLSYYAGP